MACGGYALIGVMVSKRTTCSLATFFWLLFFFPTARAGQISLAIDDIASPVFSAKGISAMLDGPDMSRFEARIGELSLQGKTWRNVRLRCAAIQLTGDKIECARGVLQAEESWPVSFRYRGAGKRLAVAISPSPGETWRIDGQLGDPAWNLRLDIADGKAARLAPWLPASIPAPGAGTIAGQVRLAGSAERISKASANLQLSQLAFTDPAGLHAGEKIGGTVELEAARRGDSWQWRGAVDWGEGEVFWQPLYFARGGHRLNMEGSFGAGALRVNRGDISLGEIGNAAIGGVWDTASKRVTDFEVRGANLDLAGLHRILLKPFLEKTALAKLESGGAADVDVSYRSGALTEVGLVLRDAFFEDEERRFALRGVNVRVPWASDGERLADIHVRGGEMLRIPLGEIQTRLVMNGLEFSLPALAVPVLDGRLNLEDFRAKRNGADWEWRFSGGLTPISMERLTEALKLPPMHGTLSGVIPTVGYRDRELKMDGALLVKVFDGTIVVQGLSILDALGRAPRLRGNLDMRNLDLDLLTRTFSFGSIQGRIDVRTDNLELAAWRPVGFDAVVQSSPGDYPRKISQRAVQNISSLGGAGAAAAIQRSFLRFFEQFGYDRIGLSCRLRNDVCLMDGVEPAPQGYVIVKGGGIPAISVIGYNHEVGWNELLERLKRITQANVKPVVQ